jgi:hypothetical protein
MRDAEKAKSLPVDAVNSPRAKERPGREQLVDPPH